MAMIMTFYVVQYTEVFVQLVLETSESNVHVTVMISHQTEQL